MLIIIACYFLSGVNTAKYNCAGSSCTHVKNEREKGVANKGADSRRGMRGPYTDPIVSSWCS